MELYAANERRAPGAAGVSQPWETLACSAVRNEYLQQHSHMQLRAAGVSQPWLANRVCKSEIATRGLRRPVASTKRRCKCVTEPRRADTRRSWLCIRQPPDNVRLSRHSGRFTEPRRADTRRSCEEGQKRCLGRLRCMKANHSDRSSRHFRVLNLYQVYRKPRRLHWYNSPGEFLLSHFPAHSAFITRKASQASKVNKGDTHVQNCFRRYHEEGQEFDCH